MCYCPTPTLHINLALKGDGAFQLSPKKTYSVWFISVLNYGDTENVLINHLLLVTYLCHYTNLCPHKPHKHAHTHAHTATTTHGNTHMLQHIQTCQSVLYVLMHFKVNNERKTISNVKKIKEKALRIIKAPFPRGKHLREHLNQIIEDSNDTEQSEPSMIFSSII